MSKKHIDILLRAKTRIESGFNTYVCNAVYNKHENMSTEHVEILKYINHAIEGETTLSNWIERRYNIDTFDPSSSNKMIATRLAWIDWMIEEFRHVK